MKMPHFIIYCCNKGLFYPLNTAQIHWYWNYPIFNLLAIKTSTSPTRMLPGSASWPMNFCYSNLHFGTICNCFCMLGDPGWNLHYSFMMEITITIFFFCYFFTWQLHAVAAVQSLHVLGQFLRMNGPYIGEEQYLDQPGHCWTHLEIEEKTILNNTIWNGCNIAPMERYKKSQAPNAKKIPISDH